MSQANYVEIGKLILNFLEYLAGKLQTDSNIYYKYLEQLTKVNLEDARRKPKEAISEHIVILLASDESIYNAFVEKMPCKCCQEFLAMNSKQLKKKL